MTHEMIHNICMLGGYLFVIIFLVICYFILRKLYNGPFVKTTSRKKG